MLFQNKKAELPIFRRVDFHYPVDKRLNYKLKSTIKCKSIRATKSSAS